MGSIRPNVWICGTSTPRCGRTPQLWSNIDYKCDPNSQSIITFEVKNSTTKELWFSKSHQSSTNPIYHISNIHRFSTPPCMSWGTAAALASYCCKTSRASIARGGCRSFGETWRFGIDDYHNHYHKARERSKLNAKRKGRRSPSKKIRNIKQETKKCVKIDWVLIRFLWLFLQIASLKFHHLLCLCWGWALLSWAHEKSSHLGSLASLLQQLGLLFNNQKEATSNWQ